MTVDPLWALLVIVTLVLALHVWASRAAPRSGAVWLRSGVLLLMGALALQPTVAGADDPSTPTATDIILVIDRTTSMGAQDYDGQRPRMEGVAADVTELVSAMPSARYSVIVMDNDARISVPWTTDTSAVATLAATTGWREETHGIGSDISVGKSLAEELLTASTESRPQARRFLLYLGDGEQTMEVVPDSFETLEPLLDDAMVLGYGTEEGGRMTLRPDTGELVERDGVPQLSRIDQSTLQTIADDMGGSYHHRTAPGSLDFWDDGASRAAGESSTPDYSLAWMLALAAAILLAGDGWRTLRLTREARGEARP